MTLSREYFINEAQKKESIRRSLNSKDEFIAIITKDQFLSAFSENTIETLATGLGLVASNAMTAMDTRLIAGLAHDLGLSGRVIQRTYEGRNYVIISGRDVKRFFVQGGVYFAEDANLLNLAVTKEGIKDSIKTGAKYTVYFSVSVNVIEWFLKDEYTLTRLIGESASDIIKIGISGIVASLAASIAMKTTVISAVAFGPLAAAVIVGAAVSLMVLDPLDKKYRITDSLVDMLNRAYNNTGKIYSKEIGKIRNPIYELNKHIEWQIQNDIQPGKGIFF